MIGIVLWSDVRAGKAIIRCEDQGDLAYYCGANDTLRTTVAKGDWVQFDLAEEGNLRLAGNARVLDGKAYPELSEMLFDAGSSAERAKPAMRSASAGNVIPFPHRSSRRRTVCYG